MMLTFLSLLACTLSVRCALYLLDKNGLAKVELRWLLIVSQVTSVLYAITLFIFLKAGYFRESELLFVFTIFLVAYFGVLKKSYIFWKKYWVVK